jgi:hypothetical protein
MTTGDPGRSNPGTVMLAALTGTVAAAVTPEAFGSRRFCRRRGGLRNRRRLHPRVAAKERQHVCGGTRAALSKRNELTKLSGNAIRGIGFTCAQFPCLQPDEAEHIFFPARQVAKRPDTGRTVRRCFGSWPVVRVVREPRRSFYRLSQPNFKRQNFKTPCHVTSNYQP